MTFNLHIVHLYPREMNIYGDTGNRLILQKRMEWRNINVRISLVGMGDEVPLDSDIILGGGAQDAMQLAVEKDLKQKMKSLRRLSDDGVVMLMVCGMYQLFGQSFITGSHRRIEGLGILPVETCAGKTRFIGNTVYQTKWGTVVGYENHSGLTQLDDSAVAFGTVIKGAGNNGTDGTEGCIKNNVFGTYSHGPVLSKSPAFADELIRLALARRYDNDNTSLAPLDDRMELRAADVAKLRSR